ncbi:hypothetical protein ACFPES_20375 [Paenibacillus sp. GCM10023248]|uniref:hypothetical protein n=1 Tax=Bacillales TaxID=1385 RepID=UPI002379944C|nr:MULTISPECIES: hypothetical protein [Bacillales]MDD9269410.1 hypothetical protein [Paenibacillus sp. MAHUQ-63]MDR6880970.1 hypothetical protein [Bacillus sp. 3255]
MDKTDHLNELNQWIGVISHNYILIIVAAIIFFACKSLLGYLTYRKFTRQLNEIKQLIADRGKEGS